MSLKKNVGQTDRTIRMAAAGVLVLLGVSLHLWFGWVLSAIGLVLLVTGFMGFCPLYRPFKIDTNKDDEVTINPE